MSTESNRTVGRTPFVSDPDFTLYVGDAVDVLAELPAESITACVTSPPYLDQRPEVESPSLSDFSNIFAELARVLTDCCLVNVGRVWRSGVEQLWWRDLLHVASYSGWALADTLVWVKPNANPIHGEVFANSHEYVLILVRAGDRLNVDGIRRPHADSTKARFGRGWTNHRGVKEPRASRARKTRAEPNPLGALPRSYVEIHVGKEKGNPHPSPMALELAEHLVKLAAKPGQSIIDPFAGSGTTARAARKHGMSCVCIEKNETFAQQCAERLSQQSLLAEEVA